MNINSKLLNRVLIGAGAFCLYKTSPLKSACPNSSLSDTASLKSTQIYSAKAIKSTNNTIKKETQLDQPFDHEFYPM